MQLNFTCFDFVQELQQDMTVGAGHCQELASLGLINLVFGEGLQVSIQNSPIPERSLMQSCLGGGFKHSLFSI